MDKGKNRSTEWLNDLHICNTYFWSIGIFNLENRFLLKGIWWCEQRLLGRALAVYQSTSNELLNAAQCSVGRLHIFLESRKSNGNVANNLQMIWKTGLFEQRCVQRRGLGLNCRERFVRFCQICQICRFRFVRFADFRNLKKLDGPTDGWTDRRTDPLRDAWTEGK